jgi:hypothetical protein
VSADSVRRMHRLLPTITVLAALFAVAAPAEAASKSCTRGGAKLLAADGRVRVVSVKEKPRNSETRRDRIYGCWTPTGRRFTLFQQRDFGLDLIERAHIEIVDGRHIGVIRHFEGGISESKTAGTWDAQKRRAVRDSKPCDNVNDGDFTGVADAVFFHGGGMAYSCKGSLRITDSKGDRELEPQGAQVGHLAVSGNNPAFGERLYWTAGETVKSLAV